MTNKLTTIYDVTQELIKNKQHYFKNLEGFQWILESLKKAKDDEMSGYRVTDDPNSDIDEDDEASTWLKENKQSKDEDNKSKKQYSSKKWQPRSDYTDKEKAAIKQLMDSGYTDREAEHYAGAHKGPKDWRSALNSNIEHPMLSDKMMNDLKDISPSWLEHARKAEQERANPELNPVKHATGVLNQAYDKHSASFDKDYGNFLNSDEVKGLKGRERHKAVEDWKSSWQKDHPEHKQSFNEASEAQKIHSDLGFSNVAAKKILQEKMQHIASGGQSTPTEMSAEEAMQHLGGGKTEDGYQGGNIMSDPSKSFGERNPKLLASLKPEQKERLDRIDSAAKAQGKIRIRRQGEVK